MRLVSTLTFALVLAGCAARGWRPHRGEPVQLPAETLDGTPVTLGGPGPIRIVHFWATWCKPCLAADPIVQSVLERHPSVQTIAMSLDDDVTAIQKHMAEHVLSGRLLRFRGGMAGANKRGINEIPFFLVIDREGRATDSHLGAGGGFERWLDQALTRALVEDTGAKNRP